MSDPPMLSWVYGQPEEHFQHMCLEVLKPEYVSPAVAYLAHQSCELNGETLVCGGGSVMRIAVLETKGAATEAITPEFIAENIDTVMDPTDGYVIANG